MNPPVVAGVDGCPDGWIAAVGPADRSAVWLTFATGFAELLRRHPGVRRWAVDIPIGLASDGPRRCDVLARQQLGRSRAASVFPAPPLPAIDAADYLEACRLAAEATGKKISKQAWNLAPKIREVREAVLADARLHNRVFETHPELCFARLAGGPLEQSKKSPDGATRRERLLADEFDHELVTRCVAQSRATRGVGVDDTLDALACWTAAERAATDLDEVLWGDSEVDASGLPIAIRW